MNDLSTALARRPILGQAELVRQLHEIGLQSGDVVLVRVDFSGIGRVQRPVDKTLVAALLEAIGPRGTLVALAHSPVQWIFRRDRNYVYEPATAPCIVGRFAQTVLDWPEAVRSNHPTASMAAIGPAAHALLHHHDHRATTFAPIRHLIETNGKFLNVGCNISSPGFSTVHHVYEALGLAERSLVSGLIGCYFRAAGAVSWFRQRDIPGCSRGFHKFYPLYEKRALLSAGKVGNADSLLIGARDAFEVEREVVIREPRFSLCEDPNCFSCRGSKLFNLRDMIPFFCVRVPQKLLRRAVNRWK